MPALKNKKHEAFARNIGIKGMSAAEAYRDGWPNASRSRAETAGPELARRSQVKDRISELREESAERAKEKDFLSVEEVRALCARIVRKKPSEISEEDPDCELVMTKAGPAVMLPSKLAAAKLDRELAPDNDGKAFEIIIRRL